MISDCELGSSEPLLFSDPEWGDVPFAVISVTLAKNLARSKILDMVARKLREVDWGFARNFLNVGRDGAPAALFIDCVQLQ